MSRILVPCDGSDHSLRAVRYVAAMAKERPGLQLELLNVQEPVPPRLHAAISSDDLHRMQSEQAERALQSAKSMLDAEGVAYRAGFRAGTAAQEIARHADETQCSAIVMGTRGLGPVTGLVIGSVAIRVVHLVQIPVTLIK